LTFTDAFTLVFEERSAVFCRSFGCCAVLVEPLPVGDCAWLVPEAGGLVLCDWVFVFDGRLVYAWFEGVAGWLVWAWREVGASVALVPVLEFVEGFVVCPDELDDGVVDDDDGVVVDVESCRCVVGGFELEVLGDDCAKADVAIATAAVVAKNKRLFI